MIENRYCLCGQPINVEHKCYERTCRTDGMRFFVPEEKNDRLCLFRCPSCSEVVEYSKLQSLGGLPIKSPAEEAESAVTSNNTTQAKMPLCKQCAAYKTVCSGNSRGRDNCVAYHERVAALSAMR